MFKINPLTRLAYFIIGHENIPTPNDQHEVNRINELEKEPKDA